MTVQHVQWFHPGHSYEYETDEDRGMRCEMCDTKSPHVALIELVRGIPIFVICSDCIHAIRTGAQL